ncbi:hypothetical protein D8B26_002346 [Coccidioides posadasii str. Silveira]|uniref:Predicted protein n=1 Tax=Coccidioides posadasii (strain RMSCC 757 / Silveira) TaxID=443226 RepID=E9DD23_COCPS|nr:predicted protein [Coccidioides posadasii str. Silveira]QVM07653.1 hypothetical protein D8B26_002346 [Coccidioides posadasii str. Silveira]
MYRLLPRIRAAVSPAEHGEQGNDDEGGETTVYVHSQTVERNLSGNPNSYRKRPFWASL